MYRISQMAALFSVSIKTLYLYEKNNLLLPAWVDPKTGYRWYDDRSVLLMSLIIALKRSGIALREIGASLSGKLTMQDLVDMLYARKEAIEFSIRRLSEWVVPDDSHTVEWGQFESRCCLARMLVASDVSEIFTVHNALFAQAVERGIPLDTNHSSFCCFHGGKLQMTDISVTVYLSIKADKAPEDAVIVPEQTVIRVGHKGPYHTLNKAYDILWAYAGEHDLAVIGDPIEVYFNCFEPGNPQTFITNILLPVENNRK